MFIIKSEKIGGMAVVNCLGRIVRSDASFKLRDAVTKQVGARVIVLDLSEVVALGGGGLGMLAFLQQWAQERGIGFKLFDPSDSVRKDLECSELNVKAEIVGMREVLSLLGWSGREELGVGGANSCSHHAPR